MNLPYQNCKIYGPYDFKDKKKIRKLVRISFPDGKIVTVSYPKYLIETHIGRYLKQNETVDHIDQDISNNELSNLQILDRIDHIKLDAIRIKDQDFICDICGKKFTIAGNQLHNTEANRKKGRSGPYCSKSCGGKASHKKSMKSKKIIRISFSIKSTSMETKK